MKWSSLTRMVMTMAMLAVSVSAFAQAADIGISGVGLLSIQPVDDAYVGSPYLSEGIGGFGPGFGAGLTVITPSGFVVGAEYTTAFFELEQSGRLVAGEGTIATTRLHDSLLTGLMGYATVGTTRVQVVGGVGARLDSPTVNDEPRDGANSNKDEPLPFVLSGGVDVLRKVGDRTALLFGARYSFNEREEVQQYLGVGPHLLRITAGLRFTLN
jgi:hypothetical protein